jgi:SAM-dependent methyltransferase
MISSIQYLAVALALKGFSATPVTRRVYRTLGNRFGQSGHSEVTGDQIERGLWVCETMRRYVNGINKQSKVLELGTGWTHFYGLFLRLFYECNLTAFDVQDNRQLNALKHQFAELARILPTRVLDDRIAEAARELAGRIAAVSSFAQLYDLLGMSYVVDANGKLDSLQGGAFDVIFSIDVLEHVNRNAASYVVDNIHRLLRPGGLSIHQIGIDDHLSHYVPLISSKNYLRYSNFTWQVFFESRVQYFNRLQMSDFEELFAARGFEVLESITDEEPELMQQITPHRQFQHYDLRSLQATRGYIVHRKPLI